MSCGLFGVEVSTVSAIFGEERLELEADTGPNFEGVLLLVENLSELTV